MNTDNKTKSCNCLFCKAQHDQPVIDTKRLREIRAEASQGTWQENMVTSEFGCRAGAGPWHIPGECCAANNQAALDAHFIATAANSWNALLDELDMWRAMKK